MKDIKNELVTMLNQALKMEHTARIQYLAHAELVSGANAEPIIDRLKELASDEAAHEEKFRTLIASYLGGKPCIEMVPGKPVEGIDNILKTNLTDEKAAINFYKKIYELVIASKDQLPYVFEVLEHEIRHVIIDEQEHVVELEAIIG